jgi:hypothetical protein
MVIAVPYATTGQKLGETREAMGRGLMKHIEGAVNKFSNVDGKYYLLVHAKPFPNHPTIIKQKIVALRQKPPMMLSCMLFGVDNAEGKLTLEWALPGDWPTWAVGGTNEPVPEVIASMTNAKVQYLYENLT